MWDKFFNILGIITSIVFGAFILALIAMALKELAADFIFNYRWKHRFDKKPTAKCYCQDCEHHGGKFPNSCNLLGEGRCTPPEGFCFRAYPRERKKK